MNVENRTIFEGDNLITTLTRMEEGIKYLLSEMVKGKKCIWVKAS